MSARDERRKQARALGAYLKTVHPDVLTDALAEIGVVRDPVAATSSTKYCDVCGRIFPIHQQLYADDHDWKPVERTKAAVMVK